MFVYGYTSAKDVVKVPMGIDEVVGRGIDPWRLDLFDPRPIVAPVAGRELAFTSLGDITYAYEEGDYAVIGMHDGKGAACLSGLIDRRTRRGNYGDAARLVIRGVASAPDQFERHFTEYLRRIFAATRARPCWMPGRSGSVWFRDGKVEFCHTEYLRDARLAAGRINCRFEGEMFSILRCTLDWRQPVMRALEILDAFGPAVCGQAVRDTACGVTPSRVDISIQSIVDEAVLGSLQDAGVEAAIDNCCGCVFEIEGIHFRVVRKAGVFASHFASRRLSIEQIAVEPVQTLVGSRIALFDLSRGQLRSLKQDHLLASDRSYPDRPAQLQEKLGAGGLRLLPDVFAREHFPATCHVEPTVPLYAEVLRYASCVGTDSELTGKGLVLAALGGGSPGPTLAGTLHPWSLCGSMVNDGGPEGLVGISVEQMQRLITEAASEATKDRRSCLTVEFFRKFLRRRFGTGGAFPPDSAHRWKRFLYTFLEEHVKRALYRRFTLTLLHQDLQGAAVGLALKYADGVRLQDSRFLDEVERECSLTQREALDLRRSIRWASGSSTPDNLLEIVWTLQEGIEWMLWKGAVKKLKRSAEDGGEETVLKLRDGLVTVHGFCAQCCSGVTEEIFGNYALLR